ncbi:hypothetical protein PV08_00028 [Exophiala spinifera]|uniref:Xylanolytic transcriptional activator regulatory domain-containing protein n=1 Tax=Exophiala spinifera TaxID=91928 RepID=A0A0D1YW10_9EURO|nr:uncharacterized protein PV08_00028 [Exophiala spinifera]KIW19456.1 hypothetical protein PV08_00028 [Exophiala spinifera]
MAAGCKAFAASYRAPLVVRESKSVLEADSILFLSQRPVRLKCDRSQPCGNCVTRNVPCVYPSRPRDQSSSVREGGRSNLDARLLRLEQLVGNIAAQRQALETRSTKDESNTDGSSTSPAVQEPLKVEPALMPGRMMGNNSQTVYVSAVHWATICDEIVKVRESIEHDPSTVHLGPSKPGRGDGPLLLQDTGLPCEVEDILSDIPPRDICDRLVSRCFASAEHWIGNCVPTYYTRFWLDPSETPLTWIGMLFGILSAGTFLYARSEDELPPGLGHAVAAMQAFHRRSTDCLIMSDYSTTPGNFTMEALLFNIQGEYVLRPKVQVGVWILSSIATRLAMRMGYHRDPERYPQISPFHGEMRRRVWATISQLDTLTSYQLGLPSIIQESQCDTKLPGNYVDEDLDPDAASLPRPRSERELTPVLYTIAKGRLLSVFRSFFNRVSTVGLTTYQDVMALDQSLNAAHDLVPPRLRLAKLEDSITVSSNILIRRYNLELVYQRARCILHRRHMTESYQHCEYEYSRSSCVDAAMNLLRHQSQIYKEVQVGGRLYKEKWFLSSLENNDFLLAAMIVCLELISHRQHSPADVQMVSGSAGTMNYTRDEMAGALQKSRNFWEEFGTSSAEAQQASTVLAVMLDKVSSSSDMQRVHVPAAPPELTSAGTDLNEIGQMLNSPSFVDWVRTLSDHVRVRSTSLNDEPELTIFYECIQDLWDAHMQNPGPIMEFQER